MMPYPFFYFYVSWFIHLNFKVGFGLGGLVFTEIQSLYINPDNYPPDLAYSDKFPKEKYSKLNFVTLWFQLFFFKKKGTIPSCMKICLIVYLKAF